jgi:hypothetical protein
MACPSAKNWQVLAYLSAKTMPSIYDEFIASVLLITIAGISFSQKASAVLPVREN